MNDHLGEVQPAVEATGLPADDLAPDLRIESEVQGRSLCIVGVDYAPDTTGIAPYTTAMARHLAALGSDVTVVTGVPYYPHRTVPEQYRRGRRWQEQDEAGVRIVRNRQLVPKSSGMKGRALFESSFLSSASPAARKVRADAYIAVTPSLSGLAAAVRAKRKNGRPLGVLVQDLVGNGATESGAASSRAGRAISSAEYSLLRQADLVGVITPRFGEILIENGIDPLKIVPLPNFTHIEPADASQGEARVALGWRLDRRLVVHTGNMGMKQGLEFVLEAAELARWSDPDIDFVLVGDGNQREDLERRAQGLENVQFVDPLRADLYPLALAAADILLLNERPSVAEMSLPSKLTSYFAAGRPVVAAVAGGGITEAAVRSSGACVVAEAGEPESILSSIRTVLGSPDLAARLSESGPAYARDHLGAEAALQRYEEFAARLLAMNG